MRRATLTGSCDWPWNPRPHSPRTGRPCSWRYIGDDSTRLLRASQSWQITCSMVAGSKPDTSYLWDRLSEIGPTSTRDPHNSPCPSRVISCITNQITNLVLQGFQPVITSYFSGKSLKEGTVNAMLRHPLEMALHRSRVAGREELCWLTAREGEARSWIELLGRVVRDIGKEIECRAASVWNWLVKPMQPAMVMWLYW